MAFDITNFINNLFGNKYEKEMKSLEPYVEKIHEATAPENLAKAPVAPAFKPIKNKPIADSIKL